MDKETKHKPGDQAWRHHGRPCGAVIGCKQPLVLIVDDNREYRLLVRELLTAQGYRATVAASGAEALKCLAGIRVDAVLLDALLPDISGYDICRRLRGEPGFETLPVIISSGQDETEQARAAARAGANTSLPKPFTTMQLMTLLQQLLPGSLPCQVPRDYTVSCGTV